MRAKISIDPRYFQEVVRKKFSASLSFIWMREVFQNSYDAGATRFDVTTGRDEHGPWVEVRDNGSGMPTVTVMLGIGAATKAKGAGGFGTAKEVVLFAWPRWEVVSGSERVTSEIVAQEGEIERLDRPVRGARIRVWHDNELSTSEFRRYLELSNGVQVYLDGERLSHFRKGSKKSTLDWAEVYASAGDQAPEKGQIVVRWEGVPMFLTWFDRPDLQLTLQLTGKCTDLLTENRESLRYPYASSIYTLRREFEKNPLSRTAENREDEIDLFVGSGVVTVPASRMDDADDLLLQARRQEQTRSEALPTARQLAERIADGYRTGHDFSDMFVRRWTRSGDSISADPSPSEVLNHLPSDVRGDFERWLDESPVFTPEATATSVAVATPPSQPSREAPPYIPGLGPKQTFGPRKKSRLLLYPQDYAVKRVGGKKCALDLEAEKYARILYGWEAACEAAVRALEEKGYLLQEMDRRFRIGFVVEGTSRAENLTAGSQRFFLLNPREIKTSESLTEIAKILFALATHEAAHIFYDHGESFDALWMDLMTRVNLSTLMSDDRVRCISAANRDLVFDLARKRRADSGFSR